MRYLLDTPVLVETIRIEKSELVVDWLARNGAAGFATTALVMAEIYQAAGAMPQSQGRNYMVSWAASLSAGLSVLAFDDAAARAFGRLRHIKALSGLSLADIQTCAVAQANDLVLATRKAGRFAGWVGVAEDPWQG